MEFLQLGENLLILPKMEEIEALTGCLVIPGKVSFSSKSHTLVIWAPEKSWSCWSEVDLETTIPI